LANGAGVATRLDELAALLRHAPDEVFLQPHNVPDPDAIASCAGLRYLLSQRGVEAKIVYDRDLEKADAILMLEVFGIEMVGVSRAETLDERDWTVLVDVQKGSSNVTDLVTEEVAAIDHHELGSDTSCRFSEIRPEIGACSTIIASWFFENGIDPPASIAGALVFGIMKDTENLTRGVSELDVGMLYRLFRFSDPAAIRRLNGSQLTKEDLLRYADAFRTVETYGGLGFMRLDSDDDSLLGSANDIVLSLDTVTVAVSWSVRAAGIKLSVRSELPDAPASDAARAIVSGIGVGGGHAHMAGGFMPAAKLPQDRSADLLIRHRAISWLESLGL